MNDKVPTTPPLQQSERDRWNYDVGFEDGHQARDLAAALQNVQDIADEMPDISTVLPQWTPERLKALSGLPVDEVRADLRQLIADLDALIADKAQQ